MRPLNRLFLTSLFALLLVSCSGQQNLRNLPPKPTLAEQNEKKNQRGLSNQDQNPTANEKQGFQVGYFDWPIDRARITRGYIPRQKRPHQGIDLAAEKGTPVLASHDGIVTYTGRHFKGYGKLVIIEGDSTWATFYAHLSKIEVQEGQHVSQGDLIGKMGNTGRSTGTHLHFEIRKDRKAVDPLLYLPEGQEVAKRLEQKLR